MHRNDQVTRQCSLPETMQEPGGTTREDPAGLLSPDLRYQSLQTRQTLFPINAEDAGGALIRNLGEGTSARRPLSGTNPESPVRVS